MTDQHPDERARDRAEVVRRFERPDLATPEQVAEVLGAREAFQQLAGNVFDTTVTSREQGKAIEALEVALDWTEKAIARYGVAS